jgi:hypothetical protein
VRLVFQNNLQAKHKPHKTFAGGRPPYLVPHLMAVAEQRALDAKVRANLKRTYRRPGNRTRRNFAPFVVSVSQRSASEF